MINLYQIKILKTNIIYRFPQKYGKHFNLEHIYKISKALNIDISEIVKKEDK